MFAPSCAIQRGTLVHVTTLRTTLIVRQLVVAEAVHFVNIDIFIEILLLLIVLRESRNRQLLGLRRTGQHDEFGLVVFFGLLFYVYV